MRIPTTLAIAFALGGFAPAADTPAAPVTKPGEQAFFDGKVKVGVNDDGTTTKFEVTFASRSSSIATKFEVKSATAKGWFVVAESAGRVWVYMGGDALSVLEYEDNPAGGPAGGKHSSVSLVPGGEQTVAALAKASKPVLDRLPALFKAPAKGK